MKKFLSLVVIFLVVFFALFQQSNKPDHSLFYIKGNDFYQLMKSDDSFVIPLPFWVIKNKVTTGEYQINYNETLLSVIQKMLKGTRVIRKITIPEGYTVRRIVEKLNNNRLLFGKITKIPTEASLMPNTYFYTFGNTKERIINQMANEMKKITSEIERENKTPLSTKEILTLASIIEKETGNIGEMPMISSVYHNRLKINMRMQSDPTVIYAISDYYGKMDRKLTRKDLFFKSPYNTYRNAGLPPEAICCPGKNAIYAAMFPKQTEYLYFVANKEKTAHLFAKNFKEHLKNKPKNN